VQSWSVTESIYSLDNWIKKLDLYCAPAASIGYIGAFAFVGATLACFVLPVAGDKFGRWTVFQIIMVAQCPLYLLALTTRHLAVVYFLCFYVGVTLIGRFTCGFVLLTELMPAKDVTVAQTLF
jgi:MFS family permease